MSAIVRWDKGGEGAFVSIDDDRVSVRSTKASAPGSPIAGQIEGGPKVRIKVARCRAEDGAFLIEGRLIDATRKDREAIAGLL